MADNNNSVVARDSLLNAQSKSLDMQVSSSESKLKVVESRSISSSTKISSSSSTSISQSSSIKSSTATKLHEIQVKEGSKAESVGIKCGDSIARINGISTEGMSLAEAQRALEYAGDDLRLSLASFDDDDNDSPPKAKRDVVLAGKVKEPTPPPQEEEPLEIEEPIVEEEPPEKPRQCWHPVMWHTPPPKTPVEKYGGTKPHGRLVKNVRRFFTECENPEERQRMIERLFLMLPSGGKEKKIDPDEEEEERRKLAELRRLSLQLRGELEEDAQ